MSTTAKRTTASKATQKPVKRTARVRVPLNLRKGPGYEHEIVRVLETDEMLSLDGKIKNGFAAVKTQDGSAGWVCAKFIEVMEGV